MSKPIKLTDDLLERIQKEFIAKVRGTKMFGGKLEYSRSFKWENSDNDRATVILEPAAFAKMIALIQQFSSEVAWHGVVHRDETERSTFHITDILVYPQTVSGATVDTDQEAYQTWLYSFDDEVFNHIRMQGHSHVNMDVNPSGVDLTHQEKLLAQVDDDDYYIFMIWNKRYEFFVRIFDMGNNTLYETEDTDVLIGGDGGNLSKFMADAKKVVTTKTYTTPTYGGTSYQSPYPGRVTPIVQSVQAAAPSNIGVKTKPKYRAESGSVKSYVDYLCDEYFGSDDEDD